VDGIKRESGHGAVGEGRGIVQGEEWEKLAFICEPETLEERMHWFLNDVGWKDEDLLFF
jgi:nitrate reductase (NAD(P)H)